MKQYLNTLFVTTSGAYLTKEGESVVVKADQEVRLRVPIHTLGGIVCLGNIMCSPQLMHHCAQNAVAVSFLSETGRFLASVHGPTSGNVVLRREQYRRADRPIVRGDIAKSFVLAKIVNAKSVLLRALRDHEDIARADDIRAAVRRLTRLAADAKTQTYIDQIRASEAEAGRVYFEVFDSLILAQKPEFAFTRRSRRPPLDNINALLSFIYVLLAHDCRAAIEAVGLDPQVGFLHAERPGRPGLALDMMEEFRPFFADRLALSLVNLGRVKASGFKRTGSGAVEMTEKTLKKVLMTYQKRKQGELSHPFLKKTAPLGVVFILQALLLARHLRGELDAYPPFVWR
jgi:CRISPR-associated protein Cas1